jgi:hypothetical protein
VRHVRAIGRGLVASSIALIATLDPSSSAAAELRDSTRVLVRLIGGITSETTKTGQPLQFVVMNDIVVDNTILIRKDTQVVGEVVKARRVHWGFTHRKPRLAFRFRYTTTPDGQVIALRSSPVRQTDDQIVVQQGTSGHALLWTGGAILFDAYVDGNYEL